MCEVKRMKKFDSSLYFITDSGNYTEEEFLFRVEKALQGGVTLLQLREKEKSTREYIKLAEKVHAITQKYNVPLIIDDFGIRKLTPEECVAFQGFPDDFSFPNTIANASKYKQAGNSVSVPVIRRIAENLIRALDM